MNVVRVLIILDLSNDALSIKYALLRSLLAFEARFQLNTNKASPTLQTAP